MQVFDRFKYMINIATQHDIHLAVSSGAWILSSHPLRGTNAWPLLNRTYVVLRRHRPSDGPAFRPRV